jgi:hypothetical protein
MFIVKASVSRWHDGGSILTVADVRVFAQSSAMERLALMYGVVRGDSLLTLR